MPDDWSRLRDPGARESPRIATSAGRWNELALIFSFACGAAEPRGDRALENCDVPRGYRLEGLAELAKESEEGGSTVLRGNKAPDKMRQEMRSRDLRRERSHTFVQGCHGTGLRLAAYPADRFPGRHIHRVALF